MKKNNKHIITLILLLTVNIALAQVSLPGTTRPAFTPRFLGWDNLAGTTGNLEIRNDWPSSIDFSTNGSATPNMTIDASGQVGIGTTTPGFILDVTNNINVTPSNVNEGYWVNGTRIIHTWSDNRSIYVGNQAGAGTSVPVPGPFRNNTFMGYRAGAVQGSDNNVFLGAYSGENTTDANSMGNGNAFVGFLSGQANTDGNDNTFLGSSAGLANTTGTGNVYAGHLAAQSATTGNGNISIGVISGQRIATGYGNIFIGTFADASI